MPTTSYDCPNCGANVRDDGDSEVVRCRFCDTDVAIPRMRRAPSRAELEAERDQILSREHELGARIKQAGARSLEDYVVPPIGCCGLYFALFVAGMLVLTSLGLKDSKEHVRIVGGVATLAALVGLPAIIWLREKRRRARVDALERERTADRDLRDDRLREIAQQLESHR
ncbi:MAG TPA: hypothetical protein VKB93_09885 [Thermoanaerobaculia bacterium]|nr:hypothetical protein [Thermoanaerobaculia bacterium]